MSLSRLMVFAALLLAPAVLAQQANQASPTKDQIARWIEQLGHADFAVREQASARLADAIDEAEPALRLAAQSPDPEIARRARLLLDLLPPMTLQGHSGRVHSVSFSPDGKRIVSAAADPSMVRDPAILGELKIWDADRGSEALSLKGHTSGIYSAAFSPDGKRIVSGSGDGTVKVWDADKGGEALSLQVHGSAVYSVAYSPDGKRIVSGSGDGTVKVWVADKGSRAFSLKGHPDRINSVAFSPDGKRIASASHDRTVKVWDADKDCEALSLKGHTDWVLSVAFSPDGKRIVSGSMDTTLTVWRVPKPR